MLAYVYNVTHHIEQKQTLAGKFHRIPKPVNLALGLRNLPSQKLRYHLYDLNRKNLSRKGFVERDIILDIGSTESDYIILVLPA